MTTGKTNLAETRPSGPWTTCRAAPLAAALLCGLALAVPAARAADDATTTDKTKEAAVDIVEKVREAAATIAEKAKDAEVADKAREAASAFAEMARESAAAFAEKAKDVEFVDKAKEAAAAFAEMAKESAVAVSEMVRDASDPADKAKDSNEATVVKADDDAAASASADAVVKADAEKAKDAEVEETYDDTAPTRIASLVIPDHFPRLCRRFALLLETRHYLMRPIDVDISRQAWTNYIQSLDYDRSYFLASDIESFKQWETTLGQELKSGNLDFPVKAFEVFRQRLAERSAFVEKMLASDIDFSVEEDFTWKRKDLPWPATQAEQDDLWRRRIKNELIGRIVSRDFAISNKAESASADAAKGKTNAVDQAAADAAPTNAEASAQASTNAPPAIDMSPEAVVGRRYKQFKDIMADADADYVLERFLSAFTMAYDPHSAYMPPSKVDDFNIDMSLKLCGIGATLQSEDGMAKIVKVIPGGPADRDTRDVKLRDGDKIYAVGQGDGPVEDIVHLPLDKIVRRIRGEKGTKVVLHVISAADPSGNTTKVVDLIRDEIRLEESAATGRVVRVSAPGAATNAPPRPFGYVHLPSFYGSMVPPGSPDFTSCTADVLDIIAGFGSVEGMILDLRGNGGGSLREAVTLAGAFIRRGPVVLVRETRGVQPLHDTDPAVAFRKPLVVLIDRASASASEIVAAALQDYGRAVIVGDSQSHGKGSVQNIMPLISSDESYGSLRITIAAFYRINGSSTQIRGVSSDIVLPSLLEYMEIGEDKLPNALPWTSIPPTMHGIVYPIGRLIPGLAENSRKRLADDPKWAAHMKKVEHIKEVGQRTTVPLDYARRYALLKADDEFGVDADIGDEGIDEDEDDEPEDDGKSDGADGEAKGGEKADDGIGDDIVLREAFNILSDLVDAQGGDEAMPVQKSSEQSDWIRRFFR